MLKDDKAEAAVRRQDVQKFDQGVKPPGRRAHSNDARERAGPGGVAFCVLGSPPRCSYGPFRLNPRHRFAICAAHSASLRHLATGSSWNSTCIQAPRLAIVNIPSASRDDPPFLPH